VIGGTAYVEYELVDLAQICSCYSMNDNPLYELDTEQRQTWQIVADIQVINEDQGWKLGHMEVK
jgi:hypothetical protein